MYSQLQSAPPPSLPPRPIYNPTVVTSPPPNTLPPQTFVKIEPIKRQLPSYTFRTLNNQSGRQSSNTIEVTQVSSKSQQTNAQYSNYGCLERAKDLDATFNPNQIDNAIFSRTYESTVTLRGADGLQQKRVDGFPETDTQKFFTKYSQAPKIQDRPVSYYEQKKKEDASFEQYLFQSTSKKEDIPRSFSNDNLLYQSLKNKEEPPTSLPPVSKATYMENYYESLVEPAKFSGKASGFGVASSYSEVQEYKQRVETMTQELTRNSLQKGQLIIQLAQLTRKNKDLVSQNYQLREQKKILSESGEVILQLKNEGLKAKDENYQLKKQKEELSSKVEELTSKVTDLTQTINNLNLKVEQLEGQAESLRETIASQPKGIVIDEQLLIEIEAIKEREMELNKLKSEFFSILESKYQEEMSRLSDLNNSLKSQIKSLKFDLDLAKESIKDKQVKIDYMQKELEALEAKTRAQSKSIKEQMQGQMHEKSSEIVALKHALHSLEGQYKAQRRELADKEDFITRYLAGRGGEEAETYKILIDKYNYLSKQQFEEVTEIPMNNRLHTPMSK